MLTRSKRVIALFTLTSFSAVLGIASPGMPAPPATGQVGVFYSYTFAPTLGTAPYTYSTSAIQLPPGLNLNPNTGVLSGTPNTSGVFNFTVSVTDSSVQQQGAVGSESLRHTRGMADGTTFGPFLFTITIAPGAPAGAPMSPAALALLMLGLAAAGIFRMRHARQA